MKSKKFTYILGLAVALLWGLIIYRVVNWTGGSDDDLLPAVSAKLPKEAYNDYTIPKDTIHLLLNYRDPFGLIKMKDTAQMPLRKVNHKLTIIAKPALNWSFIKYSGYIRNRASKKLIALVSINGKNVMLSEGDTREQVKLLKNMRDSIRVRFNGQTKCISLKTAAL
jgi:hypothetical protein